MTLADLQQKNVLLDIHFTQDEYKQLQDIGDYSVKNNLIRGGYNLDEHILLEPIRTAFPKRASVTPGKK